MSPNNDAEEFKLPIICDWSFKVFHLITSYTLCAMFFLFLPTAGYIADSYFQQPEFVEKSGAFIVMLGFLLTIKYRVVMSASNYTSYRVALKGAMVLDSIHADKLEYDKVMNVVKTEVLGIWCILIGSIINIFGKYIPLLDWCS
ncbi:MULTISPECIES: hypothetical protein [Vibrio harveyi group]|uniref:hypothetical protein n=1 Tax=Vibrio harveyi group TaxID=717610 RepID=UPI0022A8AA52|nr:hypothetical protein [Vibrio diabolicus]MCZ0925434.1 hypothetical protein [Vibrio diabolicus]